MVREKPLILIVDDDKPIVYMFSEKLKNSGFDVAVAYNGKEGWERAEREKPDAMLLDLRMPFMNGIEVLEKLKKNQDTKDIPVIILSSFNDWSPMKLELQTAKNLGVADFAEKGIDLNDLVRRLKTLLKI